MSAFKFLFVPERVAIVFPKRRTLFVIISIFSIFLILTVHCGGDRTALDVWADAEYKAAFVAKHRKNKYTIENGSATREEAAQRVLDAFCAEDGDPERWIFNESEHREILWPNLPAADQPGAVNNPDAYWEVIQTLTSVVWPRMQSWRGTCMKITRLSFRRDPEQYGEILLHYPGEIDVREVKSGKKLNIGFIRVIAEHQNRFKVSQVGPD